MSQERLNGLIMLTVEKYIVENFEYVKLTHTFASKNARRVVLK